MSTVKNQRRGVCRQKHRRRAAYVLRACPNCCICRATKAHRERHIC